MDDWLCGMKPDPPGDPNVFGRPAWIPMPSNVAAVDFGGGNGALEMTAPGAVLMFDYSYGISVTCSSATSCNAQIEFGIAGLGRSGCLFDGTVFSGIFEGRTGQHASITVPSAPGVYQVRAKIGTSQQCGGSASWSGGSEPPASGTFAILCVP
jgi:hypothetical protein